MSSNSETFYDLQVHPSYAFFEARVDDPEGLKFSLQLLPTRDLALIDRLSVELIVPKDFHVRFDGFKVILPRDSDYYKDIIANSGALVLSFSPRLIFTLPWMVNAKYPLPVWFHVVRNLFKNPDEPRWSPSIHLDDSLRFNKRVRPLQNPVKLIYGVGRNKGRRSYMEDVSFAYDFVKTKGDRSVAVYGVLDGHGGAECAQFVSDELPATIAMNLRNNMDTSEALFSSFLKVDEDFLQSSSSGAGSTASVMVWDGHSLCAAVANTGDTRSILCRQGVSVDITMDRKATDPEEIARIVREGGFVANGRVLGSLAVSRAFGDRQLKEPGSRRRVLVVDPEITYFQVKHDRDEFMVIATDGLWDVMSSQQVIDYVRPKLVEACILDNNRGSADSVSSTLSKIADQLVIHAIKDLNSMDNVTAMIILLTPCRGVELEVLSEGSNNDNSKLSQPRSTGTYNHGSSSKSEPSTNSSVLYSSGSKTSFNHSNPDNSATNSSSNSRDSEPSMKSDYNGNDFANDKQQQNKQQPPKRKESDSVEDLMDFLMDDNNF